jgi:signal transduction histidine kinase
MHLHCETRGAAMPVPSFFTGWTTSARSARRDAIPARSATVPEPAARLRLGDFIRAQSSEILLAWDEFAATVNHDGVPLDAKALRDHAAEILSTIASDLAQPQSPAQQDAKGKGQAPPTGVTTPAETHADFRIDAGFAVEAMITEYRALRASVVKIWTAHGGGFGPQDLTDLTRFNEAIDQAIAESVARYAGQAKTATDLFIGVLGHDIRNPLGTIMMSAEYLTRSGQLAPGAAAPIVNAAKRIRSIIEQVVDFTRAQTDGSMPILRLPGDLADQLAKVVQETQVRHPARTLRLESSGDFEGQWDEGRVGQLLSNLLGNALLHGGRDSEVLVRMASTADAVNFSVHNEGRPIAPEDRERIFQPLQRGPQGRDGQPGDRTGLGLGLHICREIVRAHGGTLQLESSEAAGTTFTVRLPRS